MATIVIIGVGSSLAGEYKANYDTPGSESKAASDLTKARFDGYSGQEIYVVWKDQGGAHEPGSAGATRQVLHRGREGRPRRPGTLRCGSREDRTIGTTTLPLTVPGWEVKKEEGEELIKAAEDNDGDGLEIKLGGEPIYAAQEQPAPRASASWARRSCC